jgi:cell growth-regulating nucleolar protein
MAIIAGSTNAKPSKSKTSKKRKSSSGSASTSTKKKSQKRLEAPKEQKLLEYRPGSKDSKDGDISAGQMVLFKPRADHFLSFVNKGPDSERGCSVNKALKRYHRERSESGTSLSKLMEEKELWRNLRMKKNERGEIVLFSI